MKTDIYLQQSELSGLYLAEDLRQQPTIILAHLLHKYLNSFLAPVKTKEDENYFVTRYQRLRYIFSEKLIQLLLITTYLKDFWPLR